MVVNEGQMPPPAQPQGHSVLGIISLAIGVITIILFCLIFAGAMGMLFSALEGDPAQLQQFMENPQAMDSGVLGTVALFGICMIASPAAALVGLGLGIGGFFQQGKSRVFPILGTSVNAFLLLVTCGFLAISLLS